MTWIVFLLAAVSGARAQYSLPMGEREAFMGNVGIARDGTVGNTYFNPGGLAFHRVNKLVGSGTLISISNENFKNEDYSVKSSRTQALPIAAGTAWAKNGWSWAFSAYTINSASALTSIQYNLESIGQIRGRARADEFGILIGPSIAFKLNGNTGLGASVFYYQQDNSGIISLPFQQAVGANTAVGSLYADLKTSARSLKLMAGLLTKFEYADIGIRIESGALAAQAERESTNASVFYIKNGTTILSETVSLTATQKEKIKFERPHILGAGAGVLLSPRVRLYSDVSYWLPVKFKPVADEDEVEFESSLRAGAGIEYTAARRKWLGGAHYIQDPDGDETYLYVSGGMVTLDRRSDTAIGAFYLGTLKADENEQNTIGVLFSSTIKL